MSEGGALYVSNSKNEKISGEAKVDATYVTLDSCPASCAIKDVCYATQAKVAMTTRRLHVEFEKDVKKGKVPAEKKAATKAKASEYIAAAEAAAIDESYKRGPVPKGRMLRLHVSGDTTTETGAFVIAKSIDRWKARGGGKVWCYTHAWQTVRRAAWGEVSILASMEDPLLAADARKKGYAPALVVAEFPNGPRPFERNGIKWTPCPAQTNETMHCSECKLCMNDKKLFDARRGIAFEAHGVRKKEAKRRLNVIQGTAE